MILQSSTSESFLSREPSENDHPRFTDSWPNLNLGCASLRHFSSSSAASLLPWLSHDPRPRQGQTFPILVGPDGHFSNPIQRRALRPNLSLTTQPKKPSDYRLNVYPLASESAVLYEDPRVVR